MSPRPLGRGANVFPRKSDLNPVGYFYGPRTPVVSHTPHGPGLCAELEAQYGLDLGRSFRSIATEPIDASPELMERIAADNALDMELYGVRVSLVHERT